MKGYDAIAIRVILSCVGVFFVTILGSLAIIAGKEALNEWNDEYILQSDLRHECKMLSLREEIEKLEKMK